MQRMALREFFVKDRPTLVVTFLLKGGLYQMMSLCIWRFSETVVVPTVIESFLMKKRRFTKGIFIYRDFGQPFVDGLWDVFDDAGRLVRHLVDVSGMFPGLLYGKYLPLARLSVTSRKFTTFLLASIVIFRPYLANMLHNSFLISSAWRGYALVTPRLSLYKPKLHALPSLSLMLWRR